MPISTTSQEKLIALVANASSISDEEKEEFIAAIEGGDLSLGMIERLAKSFYRESQKINNEISNIDILIAHQEQSLAEESARIEPEAQALVHEHDTALHRVHATYMQECNAIEKETEHEVEGAVRQDEQSQADAIRQSLRKKPS